MYPTGILLNRETNRYHPISFRPAPMPGLIDSDKRFRRYRSLGHHTAGFGTLEAAQNFIEEHQPKFIPIGIVWDWDGKDMPIMTEWAQMDETT